MGPTGFNLYSPTGGGVVSDLIIHVVQAKSPHDHVDEAVRHGKAREVLLGVGRE
jgi:hypothetical protein